MTCVKFLQLVCPLTQAPQIGTNDRSKPEVSDHRQFVDRSVSGAEGLMWAIQIYHTFTLYSYVCMHCLLSGDFSTGVYVHSIQAINSPTNYPAHACKQQLLSLDMSGCMSTV